MPLDRRRFLSGLAAGVAAGALLPFRSSLSAAQPLVGEDSRVDWSAVRAEFDLDPRWIHLSTFFLVSHPRPVREAIERWRRQIDQNPLSLEEALFHPGTEHPLESVKRALGEYMGGSPEEIALTPNTTTGPSGTSILRRSGLGGVLSGLAVSIRASSHSPRAQASA